MDHKDKNWYRAQSLIQGWLRYHGVHSHLAGYLDPYDLVTNSGKRLEIKLSEFCPKKRHWSFNIQRHNILDESQVDAYVLRFNPGAASVVLGIYPFHLVMPAPIGVKNIRMAARNLLCGRWAEHFNNVEILR